MTNQETNDEIDVESILVDSDDPAQLLAKAQSTYLKLNAMLEHLRTNAEEDWAIESFCFIALEYPRGGGNARVHAVSAGTQEQMDMLLRGMLARMDKANAIAQADAHVQGLNRAQRRRRRREGPRDA